MTTRALQPPRIGSTSWLYGLTILLGAFLVFQVQPIISKTILPWFGGGPSVWTTCMLFFQVLLFGGYLYAHWLSRLRPLWQLLCAPGSDRCCLWTLPTPGRVLAARRRTTPTDHPLALAATVGQFYSVVVHRDRWFILV
jgi:hypothetical protein